MDIPVNAAKPGRRRYLTLVMIFITVVICYVDRANLAVASAHIQEEFGITKAEMGYVFSAFAWLYTLCQIPGGWFLDRVGSRVTYFIAIFGWSVATLFQGPVGSRNMNVLLPLVFIPLVSLSVWRF